MRAVRTTIKCQEKNKNISDSNNKKNDKAKVNGEAMKMATMKMASVKQGNNNIIKKLKNSVPFK